MTPCHRESCECELHFYAEREFDSLKARPCCSVKLDNSLVTCFAAGSVEDWEPAASLREDMQMRSIPGGRLSTVPPPTGTAADADCSFPLPLLTVQQCIVEDFHTITFRTVTEFSKSRKCTYTDTITNGHFLLLTLQCIFIYLYSVLELSQNAPERHFRYFF